MRDYRRFLQCFVRLEMHDAVTAPWFQNFWEAATPKVRYLIPNKTIIFLDKLHICILGSNAVPTPAFSQSFWDHIADSVDSFSFADIVHLITRSYECRLYPLPEQVLQIWNHVFSRPPITPLALAMRQMGLLPLTSPEQALAPLPPAFLAWFMGGLTAGREIPRLLDPQQGTPSQQNNPSETG